MWAEITTALKPMVERGNTHSSGGGGKEGPWDQSLSWKVMCLPGIIPSGQGPGILVGRVLPAVEGDPGCVWIV